MDGFLQALSNLQLGIHNVLPAMPRFFDTSPQLREIETLDPRMPRSAVLEQRLSSMMCHASINNLHLHVHICMNCPIPFPQKKLQLIEQRCLKPRFQRISLLLQKLKSSENWRCSRAQLPLPLKNISANGLSFGCSSQSRLERPRFESGEHTKALANTCLVFKKVLFLNLEHTSNWRSYIVPSCIKSICTCFLN